MQISRFWLLGTAGVALALGGCAERAGSQAMKGGLSELAAASLEGAPPGERPAEVIAGRMAEGVVGHLSEPDQLAQLRALIATSSAEAVASGLRALIAPGPEGQGAITVAAGRAGDAFAAGFGRRLEGAGQGLVGRELAAAVEGAAEAATTGGMRALRSACPEGDGACLDRRVAALGRAAALGFMSGVRERLSLAALAGAFVGGIACALIALWIWSNVRLHRQLRATAAHEGA